MAAVAFPGIKPSIRSWTPGSRPVKTFVSTSGYEARVLLGPHPVGGTLTLGFDNLSEEQFFQITSHYATARSNYETFALPAEVFAGIANASSLTPVGFSWRYMEPPGVEWVAPGIASVRLSLQAVLE
jgi:hypothetical protein